MSETAGKCRLELLGSIRVVGPDGVVCRLPTRKSALLLAYLALDPTGAAPRERLAELFWPESPGDLARHSLSQALSLLRQILSWSDRSIVVVDRQLVGLDRSQVEDDVSEFRALLDAAQEVGDADERHALLYRAVQSYRGELLSGYSEGWVWGEQQRLSDQFHAALSELAEQTAPERSGAVLEHLYRALQWDPLRESSHQLLIRTLIRAGRSDAARRQYRELCRVLRDELGAEPSPETRSLMARLDPPSPLARGPEALPMNGLIAPPVAIRTPLPPAEASLLAEGPLPPDSPCYLTRAADQESITALRSGEATLLIRGPRQTGKTSLLGRIAREGREAGFTVVHSDFQLLTRGETPSLDGFLHTLAAWFADEIGEPPPAREEWSVAFGPILNFRRVVRRILSGENGLAVHGGYRPILWMMDDVDHLFPHPFATEFFALLRSWHNERALDPASVWHRLTLVMSYATEAQLFISDPNQSPFNIGTRLELQDLTPEETGQLNAIRGNPLATRTDTELFQGMVGGHPYLVQTALATMAHRKVSVAALRESSLDEAGPFGSHLRALGRMFRDAPDLAAPARELLRGKAPNPTDFLKLRCGGIVVGDSAKSCRFRCGLYEAFLGQLLGNA